MNTDTHTVTADERTVLNDLKELVDGNEASLLNVLLPNIPGEPLDR